MDQIGLDTEVAIVGLAGLFPKSRTIGEFWNHIVAQSDCIEDIPPSRWSLDDHFDSDQKASDKTYSRRGGFVPAVDFDPLEFGLPPKTLESIDTAQMLALLVARDALADAGYGPEREFARERTGVILGVSGTTMKLQASLRSRLDFPHWSRILTAAGVPQDTADDVLKRASQSFVPWTEDSFPGMLANVVSGRIANRLNLGGINCAVDAACASALCAVNFAIGALVSRTCDMVITGGVDVDNSIQAYMSFSKTPVLSASQCIRPFDAAADGTIISEAVAMLVLKRRSDAIRDRDRIYAVIRGIGVSSDGRCESIYAPRSEGQARALRQAYAQAGVSPADVDLVEAHATGTQVGDAVEFRALSEVFGEAGAGQGSVAIGSIKSQFGHAKAAAGALSLIKTVLSLHHKVIPPTINLTLPNPTLNAAGAPFYFSTETRPWIARSGSAPRRAGISASGFGGANYHLVLEEAQSEVDSSYRLHGVPWVGFVSAPTPDALRSRCSDIAVQIERGAAARTLLTATSLIAADHPRIAFTASDAGQAVLRLKQCCDMINASGSLPEAAHPDGIWYRQRSVEGKTAALFPGQGSQYVNMGLALGLDFPEHRAVIAEADSEFTAAGHEPLSGAVYPKPATNRDRSADERRLRRTLYAQTAVAAMSISTWKLLKAAGCCPQYAAGHSLGELTALWASGAIPDGDILNLIRKRGEAFSPAAGIEAGALTAVTGDVRSLSSDLADFPNVRIANINAPQQTVIGGPKADLEAAEPVLEQNGYTLSRLPVAAAFHTPSVAYGADIWIEALRRSPFDATAFPVCSNTTGEFHQPSADLVRSLLARHPLEPVRFMECIERLYAEGVRVFLEVGPRSILSRLVTQILGDRPHTTVATNPSRDGSATLQLQQAAAQLMALGISLQPVDRYFAEETPPKRAPSGVTIKLEAGNYLLPETQQRMREALSPAPAVSSPRPITAPQNGARVPETAHSPASTQSPTLTSTRREPVHMSTSLTQQPAPQDALARLYELEHAQLDVHRQFLTGQQEQAALLSQLAQQQGALAAMEGGAQSWERVVERVVEHQSATVGIHQSYLDMQAQVAGMMIGLAQGATFASSTSQRTEAVEPAIAHNGHAPHAKPEHPLSPAAPMQSAPAVPSEAYPSAPVIHFASPAPQAPADLHAQLADQLLELVSAKTGYPVDLIGLDSDLEADLGIDSIKRIEILASLPKSLGMNSGKSHLSELRTLREILAVMATMGSESGQTVTENSSPPMATNQTEFRHFQTILEGPSPGVMRLETLPSLSFHQDRLGMLPKRRAVLIVDDGTATADAAAAMVSEAGHSVAILGSSSPAPKSTWHHVVLASFDDAGIALALQEVSEKAGPIGAVIYLHRDESAGNHDRLKLALLVAKHCGPALRATAAGGRPAFIAAVGMDGAMGISGAHANPSAGGLFGLVKSLAQEWPDVFCRAVDLGRESGGKDAAVRLLAELTDKEAWPVEVAHTADRRVTLGVHPLPVYGPSATSQMIPAQTTFLLTGGARGVTAACAVAIAKQFRCRLVLLGRTANDVPEEAWSQGVTDAGELKRRLVQHLRDHHLEATPRTVEARFTALIQQREAQTTLAAIRQAGASVVYKSVDISNAQAVRDALSDIGAIDGLIHGAGAIADSRIERKTAAEFDRVFAPKVDGLHNLLAHLDTARLRHIVLFSSTAAVSGNAGQSDYAMANEVLNKQAHELKQQLPECHVVSICWGPWDGGMVTPDLAKRFQSRGIRTISKEAGAAFLIDRLLQASDAPVQVVLGDLLPPPEIPKFSDAVSGEFPGVLESAVAHDRSAEEATV